MFLNCRTSMISSLSGHHSSKHRPVLKMDMFSCKVHLKLKSAHTSCCPPCVTRSPALEKTWTLGANRCLTG